MVPGRDPGAWLPECVSLSAACYLRDLGQGPEPPGASVSPSVKWGWNQIPPQSWRLLLRFLVSVFLLEQPGALAEEGAESAGPLPVSCPCPPPGTGGPADPGLGEAVMWPETPVGVVRKCPTPHPPAFWRVRQFGEAVETRLEGMWGA